MTLSTDHRTRRGVAMMNACLVQTIAETDSRFQERYLERLTALYYELRDNSDGDVLQELELVSWTREFLTGFNHINGPGDPLLSDYTPG